MPSLSAPALPVQALRSFAPVRHGRCKLHIRINGCEYSVRRVRGPGIRSKVWLLQKEESGQVYSIRRADGFNTCTCPDQAIRGAECKHLRALAAVGLVGKVKARPAKGGA